MLSKRRRPGAVSAWLLLAVAAVGLLAALALPIAPVHADRTTLTWPAPGAATASTTAQVVPYRPTELSATVPCRVIEAARTVPGPTTVLATAPDAEGLVLRTENGRLRMLPGDRDIDLPTDGPGCALTVRADSSGIVVAGAATPQATMPGPVPQVLGLRTALSAGDAAGLTVTVHVDSPFATRPAAVKLALVGVAMLAAAISLVLLHRLSSPTSRPRSRSWSRSWSWRRGVVLVDAGVIGLLCGWAVIGPLAVDDGWATTIARNVAATGSPGNYYRWWNAAESPFALSQQLLAPLTQVSLAPLWLRVPSTVLAVATWFVLSRGLLGAALPGAATARVRLVAAVALLAAWLPFNLGTRPESYVAFGLVVVLALLWRARGPAALGWAVLVAALTVAVSPSAVMVIAPFVVFAPRAIALLRRTAADRVTHTALVAALGCLAAVAVVAVFADQTWDGVRTATRWHHDFGPSLPWYREPERYRYLLGDGQQGSAAKRIPVLLSLALTPVVLALAARRRRGATAQAALRITAVLVLALALLAFAPSKWSFHLGAAAGLLAAFLTIATVASARFAAHRRPGDLAIAGVGGLLVTFTAATCFAGSNAWWLPVVYDVPWSSGPVRPWGVPLSAWWLWLVYAVVAGAVLWRRRRGALLAGPAAVAALAAALSVALLMVSFTAAPLRRPAGSLALVNAHRITGGPYCGLADDIEVLADGAPLTSAGPGPAATEAGFTALGGFDPDAPPPDTPGTGMSAYLWGSRGSATGRLVSQWFVVEPGTSVGVSVNGRADSVRLEFGRASSGAVVASTPPLAPEASSSGEDNSLHPTWRSVGLAADRVPAGADRVRVLAAADTRDDWVAVTGPRTRNTMPLNAFLSGRGPVLVGWPQAFLFPCIQDIAGVSAGVAETPRVVLASPGLWFTEPTDQSLGGTFAALVPYGRLYEVPSRLAGQPELHWGTVLVSADTTGHDTYRRETTTVTRWGHRVG